MGLGVSGGGVGVARFLARRGAKVTVTDLSPPDRLAESIAALHGLDIHYVLGEHREADVLQADFVVRNPAVPRTHPLLQLAEARGLPIYMEMTLFFLECPSSHIVGVTGTKGKTTTTTLLGEVLGGAGRDVVVAGNLRISALEQLSRIGAETDVVLELSSFQLEGLEGIATSPPVAVITNLMNDHLNRYPSLEAYYGAKQLVFRFQDRSGIVALNRDNPPSRDLAREAPGESGVVWARRCRTRSGCWPAARGAQPLIVPPPRPLLGRLVSRPALSPALWPPFGVSPTARSDPGARRGAVRERLSGHHAWRCWPPWPPGRVVLIAGGADKALDFSALGEAVAAPSSRVRAVVLLEGDATDKVAAAR